MTDPAPQSAPLADALTSLTLALDEPGADLADSVAEFAIASRLAVSSYAGMSVYASVNGHELGFTTFDDHVAAHDIATSLRLVLNPSIYPASDADEVDGFPSIALILYATTPGAFVDLSADLAWLLASRAHDIALDQDLTPPDLPPIDVALAETSSIDQATGVLIGRGHTPDHARQHLATLSSNSGNSLAAEAEHLLDSLGTDQQDPNPTTDPTPGR